METEILSNHYAAKQSKSYSKSKGLLMAGVTGGLGFAITLLCYPFVSPALRRVCLPFVPATKYQIVNIFRALEGRRGTLLDIGSGDGRVVIEAARKGFQAFGVELNIWLVLYSRLKALRSGLVSSAKFSRDDLWKTDFTPYDNIVIFGVKEMMNDICTKFENELGDTYVAACRFQLPNRKPIKIIGSGIDRVWLYHFVKERNP